MQSRGVGLARRSGTANILGSGPSVNRVSAFSTQGFVINDKRFFGAVALAPHLVLNWNVDSFDKLTTESLELFTVFVPAIEIIVIGCGKLPPPRSLLLCM